MKASLNNGLSEILKDKFPDIVLRAHNPLTGDLYPFWVAGFLFFFYWKKKKNTRWGLFYFEYC
jgi:hypothetical protein